MKRLRRLRKADRGANLVEFAMVMPFLLILLIGIVEFSWTLANNIDVTQGAREGARITAVDFPDTGGSPTNGVLAAEICNRMDLVNDPATTITWLSNDLDGNGQIEVGDGVNVTVSTPHKTLTGFMDWAFGGLTSLDSTVEIRIEQPRSWIDTTVNCP